MYNANDDIYYYNILNTNINNLTIYTLICIILRG